MESYHLSNFHLELLFIKLVHWMRIHCGGLQDSSFLSSYGDGAITGSFVKSLVFLHALHLCFCKTCVDFCSCEGDNNHDGLKTLDVHTFTNFEFVGVAWAQVRTITSRASLIHGFVVFLFSLKKPFATLDLRLNGYVINYFLFFK